MAGTDIRGKRAELGLTQKEFAAALGMGPNGERTVRRWEAGETAPSAAESAFISSLGHSAPFDQGDRPNAAFTYVDLFAGIGGIRMPFQELGGRCVFSCEWDRFAQKTYRMNYGETPAGDIREVAADDIPDFDVLLAGFPASRSRSPGYPRSARSGAPRVSRTRRKGPCSSRSPASSTPSGQRRSSSRT